MVFINKGTDGQLTSSSPSRRYCPSTIMSSFPQHLPAIPKFKVALCQLTVTSDKKRNLSIARRAIESAAEQGATLVMLPEMWSCPFASDNFAKFAEDFTHGGASPALNMLSDVASTQRVTIVGGSVPEHDGGKLYNTCFVFGPDGKLIAKHRKIHLFDIHIPGEIQFLESDSFSAGETPTIVNTDAGCIGIGICHDMRFPELAMLYKARGAQLICYPGAFNMSTGEMLWELVQRARAVDNQVFVASCSPSRDSDGSYMIWGHSTLIGTQGEVIATSGHDECVVIGEIDYAVIEHRQRMRGETAQAHKWIPGF